MPFRACEARREPRTPKIAKCRLECLRSIRRGKEPVLADRLTRWFNALGALGDFDKPAMFALLESGNTFSPCVSILSSVVLMVVMLGMSTYEFSMTDY